MLIVQIVLGGITRLTGSGLSITEWNIVTGTIPPLSQESWVAEFDKYKQTPQFQILNADFTLSDFKFIFFWEWFHRFWARLIGVVFIVGFVYLISRKKLKAEMQNPLLILFLLGALQGAIGWIMVASGLTGDAIYVKPTKLALHFISAMVLVAYTYWFYLKLTVKEQERFRSKTLVRWVWVLLLLLTPQLIYGALMAGHKAATAAPTWPTINGDIVPGNLLRETPLLLNFIENKITIHFVHRSLAFLLFISTLIFTIKSFKLPAKGRLFIKNRLIPLALVCLQALLGILSVRMSTGIVPNVWGSFEWMAQLHQIVGMMLLLGFIYQLYLLSPRKTTAPV